MRKYKQYQSQGFVVVGVDVQDTSPDTGVLAFMRNTLVNFPIVRDLDSSVASMYRINGLPTSFFVDKSGVIRDVVVGGPMTDAFIDQQYARINQ